MDWISVEEDLPVGVPEVLLCSEFLEGGGKMISLGHLSEYSPKSTFEGFRSLGESDYRKITHWAYLPELPES